MAFCVVVLPVAGAVSWYFADTRNIDVLVFDATVPTSDRRQHRGVDLAFTYFKVPFDPNRDYVGTGPGGVPFGEWPTDRPDLALLVDAYGVYIDSSGRIADDGTIRVTDSFPMAAAQDVVGWAEQGTIVMGEFNILHEPTDPDVSEVLQGLFSIDAMGWTGRSFENLEEVSQRIKELHDGPWDYEGPGIIVVGSSVGDRSNDPVVIVLTPDLLDSDFPIISGIPASNGRLVEVPYTFWFALIEADSDAETTMWLDLPVNERGIQLLAAHGVPDRTPFVVRTEHTVYVAGNVATTPALFPTRKIWGSLAVLQWLPNSPDADVFYEVYAPIVSDLLDQADS